MTSADSFGSGPTALAASLRTTNGVVPLRVPASQTAMVDSLAGRYVDVRGTTTNGVFLVSDVAAHSPGHAAPAADSHPVLQPMRVAVVLMHAPGSSREGVTPAQAQSLMFGVHSVASWFADVSGGRAQVSGKVFGYYDSRLPANDCNLSDWVVGAGAAALRDGYSSNLFTSIVVYTPGNRCPFDGTARVGSNGVYLDGVFATGIIEHELGHNLGLGNAGAYTCSPPTSSCLAENGDLADVMGTPDSAQFSAAHKYRLGWLPASAVRTLTSGEQTFGLSAPDHGVAPGATALVVVPRPDGSTYAIERQGGAVGSPAPGVVVRISGAVRSDDTELVVRQPLTPGQSYSSAAGDLTVTAVTDAAGTASVHVCAGACSQTAGTTTTTSTGPSTTTSPPTTVPTTVPAQVLPTSPMLVDWGGGEFLRYSDAQLAGLARLGVTGLVVGFGWLPDHGLGGSASEWSGIPDDFAARCRRVGITKLWASFEPGAYNVPKTPFGDWFDDGLWSGSVRPSLTFVLGTLRAKGWTGIGFDNEMYPGVNNQRPTWNWNYAGNTHSQAQVRAQARLRGQQLAGLVAANFPGAEVITYHDYFGDGTDYGYHSLLEHVVNKAPIDMYAAQQVTVNFYDGLTSVPGVGRLTIGDASFYYGSWTGVGWGDDAHAMQRSAAGTKAYLSRVLTNKAVNVFPEPMVLLGPSNGDGSSYSVSQAMTPARALVVARAARAASTGGIVINYWPGDVHDQAAIGHFTGDYVNGVPRLVNADLRPAYTAAAGR